MNVCVRWFGSPSDIQVILDIRCIHRARVDCECRPWSAVQFKGSVHNHSFEWMMKTVYFSQPKNVLVEWHLHELWLRKTEGKVENHELLSCTYPAMQQCLPCTYHDCSLCGSSACRHLFCSWRCWPNITSVVFMVVSAAGSTYLWYINSEGRLVLCSPALSNRGQSLTVLVCDDAGMFSNVLLYR